MDPLKPSAELLLKLAAIVVRADRYVSPAGSMLDLALLGELLVDPEAREWIAQIKRQLPADPSPFLRRLS